MATGDREPRADKLLLSLRLAGERCAGPAGDRLLQPFFR
jgi:hypothetical protein